MRIVARYENEKQVNDLVDSLRKTGFKRKDMIISNLAKEEDFNTLEEAADEITFLKTERNGLGEYESYSSGIEGLEGNRGIIVSVEAPKRSIERIRFLMEDTGASEILKS